MALDRSLDEEELDSFASYLTRIRSSFSPELNTTPIVTKPAAAIRISLGTRYTDDELDIFDAEKYFSGAMDGYDVLLGSSEISTCFSGEVKSGTMKSSSKAKSRSGSTWSEISSTNSRSTLLRDPKSLYEGRKDRCSTRSNHSRKFLGVLRCCCVPKDCAEIEKETEVLTAVSSDSNFAGRRKLNWNPSAVDKIPSFTGSSTKLTSSMDGEDDTSLNIESVSEVNDFSFEPDDESSIQWSVVTAGFSESTGGVAQNDSKQLQRRRRRSLFLGCASDEVVQVYKP